MVSTCAPACTNGYALDVDTTAAHRFINASIARKTFNFTTILAWLKSQIKTLEP